MLMKQLQEMSGLYGIQMIYFSSKMDDLIDVAVKHMVTDEFPEEQAREYMKDLLPKLDYWKRYDELSDGGQYVNLSYPLPSG